MPVLIYKPSEGCRTVDTFGLPYMFGMPQAFGMSHLVSITDYLVLFGQRMARIECLPQCPHGFNDASTAVVWLEELKVHE